MNRQSRPHIRIRAATMADAEALNLLIDLSVRALQRNDYSEKQIEGALGTVLGLDTKLIEDGTYLVAEIDGPEIVGCGGWSKRKTLFGGDHRDGREDALLRPGQDAAKIRAFFVHPRWARQGVASELLTACENAALQAGFERFEMGATLTGVALYESRGYVRSEQIEVPLSNGHCLPVVRMSKSVAAT